MLRPNLPPSLARRFLRWFLRDDLLEEVEGDLEEKFYATAEKSLHRARLNYWYQVFHYLRPFAIRNLKSTHHLTHYAMYRSYVKIGWRNLLKYKGYSLINIGGLAVGMAVALLIGLWVYDELSFNTYHENYDRIAQVMQNQVFDGEIETWQGQAMQLAPVLRQEYGSHFRYVIMSMDADQVLTYQETALTKGGDFMSPEAPYLLSLKMLRGTRAGLQDLHSILLSESVAQALFGDDDPLGKTIRLDNQLEVAVTGVYEDIPDNSSFQDLGFIAPWELLVKSANLEERVGWGNSWFRVFVQVAENVDMAEASAAIRDAKLSHVGPDDARFQPQLFLHPMAKWHLFSAFENGVSAGGRIEYVWLFGIIGVFVLLLACINFMNLSTARSEKRAKEVGVRKVVGSVRSQLVSQFFSESIVTVILAFIIALLLARVGLPWFNEVAGKQLALPWINPWFWVVGLGFSLLTGLIAGSYPALYLSSFRPIKVLRGGATSSNFRVGRWATLPRKVLVVLQFTVSVTLMVGTLVVYQQIEFAKNRPIGYEREGLVNLPMETKEVQDHYEVLRQELLATGAVSEVAMSESTITNTWINNSGFTWPGKDPDMQDIIVTNGVTHEFGKTIGWTIREGRDFSRDFATDSAALILNETAVEYMNLDDPIGTSVKAFGREYTVIGVVKDLVTQSIYEPVKQTIFYIDNFNRASFINIKINPAVGAAQALTKIETVFNRINPATPFAYQFADDEFAAKFAAEERVGTLAGFFATLAVLISCLGLFGLASYLAERRTKEIGVRKVLGASVANLWQLLSKDFIGLVIIACLIAVPIAYYSLYRWLQNYEYRTDISWWVFATMGLGALLIALMTVSYQTIKAALMNPVKSLRSE